MMDLILHQTFLGAFFKGPFQELLPTNAPFKNSILWGKDEPRLSLDWVHLDLPYLSYNLLPTLATSSFLPSPTSPHFFNLILFLFFLVLLRHWTQSSNSNSIQVRSYTLLRSFSSISMELRGQWELSFSPLCVSFLFHHFCFVFLFVFFQFIGSSNVEGRCYVLLFHSFLVLVLFFYLQGRVLLLFVCREPKGFVIAKILLYLKLELGANIK